MCEYSRKQIEKFIRETEQLNISRDKNIGLHADFLKQLADANHELKRTPTSDDDIQFVANIGQFDDKHTLLEDVKIQQYPLIVKYILCCEVAHILKAYQTVLEKIVKLCSKCQSERDIIGVDRDIDEVMVAFQQANKWFVLFSQNYKKGDVGGDNYGTGLNNALVESTKTMHDMFKDDKEVKRKMREICKNREELKESRAVLFTRGAAAGMGGNRSRSKSKFKSKKQKLSIKKKQKLKRDKRGKD